LYAISHEKKEDRALYQNRYKGMNSVTLFPSNLKSEKYPSQPEFT